MCTVVHFKETGMLAFVSLLSDLHSQLTDGLTWAPLAERDTAGYTLLIGELYNLYWDTSHLYSHLHSYLHFHGGSVDGVRASVDG